MGVYNCKDRDMLQKSIQSIINQTYTDWEFIICDDGSTNDTRRVLEEIGKFDDRIIITGYEKNRGLSYALNFCSKIAQGEYIARQDDDDISMPARFEKQVQILEKYSEYSIVGTNAEVFDDEGVWGQYIVEETPTKKSFLWSNPFAHPTVLIRTNDLRNSGYYRVAKETRRCEDYDLFMRMYSLGYRGYNIQDNLYQYRISNGKNKYRPMKYRVDEAIVRFIGYKKMGILAFGMLVVLKPILIGLIPQKIFRLIRKIQY